MMKKAILLLICISLAVTGCASKQPEINNGINNEINNEINTGKTAKEYKSLAEMMYDLMQGSKENMSVFWDGTNITAVENDNTGGEDRGYSDFRAVKHYMADNLIMFDYPSTFEQADADEDEPDTCHFVKGDAEFYVSRINYEEESSQFDKNEDYIEIDFKGLKEETTGAFEKYKTYFGIKETDGQKKAGYVLIFENKSELAKRDYKIEVYGMGDMDYVTILALTVMSNFSVVWFPLG